MANICLQNSCQGTPPRICTGSLPALKTKLVLSLYDSPQILCFRLVIIKGVRKEATLKGGILGQPIIKGSKFEHFLVVVPPTQFASCL